MDLEKIVYRPIGIIHSPFKEPEGTPIQPRGGRGIAATAEIDSEFTPALSDLAGFSHLILIYHFHRAAKYKPKVTPFLDDTPRGLFATRSPSRPNPVGLSVVRLIKIESNILHIEDVDILDDTPLLDIKPYVPNFDEATAFRLGWLENRTDSIANKMADSRFIDSDPVDGKEDQPRQ